MLSSIGMSMRAVNWLRHSSINTSLSVLSISEPNKKANISSNKIHLNSIILQHLTESAAERFHCIVVLYNLKIQLTYIFRVNNNNNNNNTNTNKNTTFQCHCLLRHFFLVFSQSERNSRATKIYKK